MTLEASVEKWARIAIEREWARDWVEGAIFPREMVAFIALCETRQVATIIESGRQDGYSTQALAQYAEDCNGLIVSIDDEPDAERAADTRRRLERYARLSLVKGDSFSIFGKHLRAQRPKKCAVLVDGPKSFEAMALTFAAAASRHVFVIGQHNLERGQRDTKVFQYRSGRGIHYEDLEGFRGPAWDRLGEEERIVCGSLGARRSLEESSLGLIDLAHSRRSRLSRTTGRAFRAYQPWAVAILWRLGMFRAAGRLFKLSFRFLA